MTYMTGKEAWDHYYDKGGSDLWLAWSNPEDHPESPFQYCSVDGGEGDESCGCLTQVHCGAHEAEKAEWTEAIREDLLLVETPVAFERMLGMSDVDEDEALFIATWNRFVEWQLAMRKGKMPTDLEAKP